MNLGSPLWLLGLLPWIAVTAWLFTGRREGMRVPFLQLWKGPNASVPRARKSIELPPFAILCVILAMFLAILGAAKPQFNFTNSETETPRIDVQNIGIVTASADTMPRGQVMVRVRNDSDSQKASLKITSADKETTSTIELPPRAQERNYFVDLEIADATIAIELLCDVPNDSPADNRATLSLAHSPPVLVPVGNVPPEIQRIAATYNKLKSAGVGPSRVVLTTKIIAPDRAAVMLDAADAPQTSLAPAVLDHPINAHVDWQAVLKQNVRVAQKPVTGSGWQTIVSMDEKPMVAVRASPARQVWVGFTSDTWPRTSEFVIFWTNVFDWIAANPTSSRYAFNRADAPVIQSQPTSQPVIQSSGFDAASVFLTGSLATIFVAALVWGTCKNCASS